MDLKKDILVYNFNSSLKKVNLIKKSDNLKTLLKLKQQEYVIERSIRSHLENVKINNAIIQEIHRDQSSQLRKREKLMESLKKSVELVKKECAELVENLTDFSKIVNLDLDEYKLRVKNLWQKIQEFHSNKVTEHLIEEEKSLDYDLMEFNVKLNQNENFKDFKLKLPRNINQHTDSDSQNFEDVQNFRSLVNRTGHTQNWTNEDHLLFLKLRKNYSNIPALVNAIQSKCPDLSVKCIVNHEAWYKLYLQLREQQRCAVKEWRKQREFERAALIEESKSEIERGNGFKLRKSVKVREKKKTLQENVKEQDTEISSAENEIDKKRKLIKNWKKEKEEERLMNEKRERVEELSSRRILDKFRKARIESLRNSITEYKKRKSLESLSTRDHQKENGEKIIKSNYLLKSFREQDRDYVEKKKKKMKQRTLETRRVNSSNLNEIQVKKLKETRENRESTLFKSTKVWHEKHKNLTKKTETTNPGTTVIYIKDLPRMSLIRWHNEERLF